MLSDSYEPDCAMHSPNQLIAAVLADRAAQQESKPDAWVREWDGDDSDLGNTILTDIESDTHDGYAWEPLYKHPPQQERKPDQCEWKPEDEDFMPGTYASACGELWSFIDGGPVENRVRFCQGCGKPVALKETP